MASCYHDEQHTVAGQRRTLTGFPIIRTLHVAYLYAGGGENEIRHRKRVQKYKKKSRWMR